MPIKTMTLIPACDAVKGILLEAPSWKFENLQFERGMVGSFLVLRFDFLRRLSYVLRLDAQLSAMAAEAKKVTGTLIISVQSLEDA